MPYMEWLRAADCEATACVEVNSEYGNIGIRNSKIPGESVWFDSEEWAVFVEGVKAGDFDHVDPGRSLS